MSGVFNSPHRCLHIETDQTKVNVLKKKNFKHFEYLNNFTVGVEISKYISLFCNVHHDTVTFILGSFCQLGFFHAFFVVC